jgi:hypothetical protein
MRPFRRTFTSTDTASRPRSGGRGTPSPCRRPRHTAGSPGSWRCSSSPSPAPDRPPIGLRRLAHRLLHHGGECLLGHAARLQKAREVGALAQLGDAQFDRTSASLPDPVAVAVTLGQTLGGLLAIGPPVCPSTSSSIRRWAAKPIISRNRSASGVFSTSVRRFIISSVIGGSSVALACRNPILPANRR